MNPMCMIRNRVGFRGCFSKIVQPDKCTERERVGKRGANQTRASGHGTSRNT